jgi:hypothetical protein
MNHRIAQILRPVSGEENLCKSVRICGSLPFEGHAHSNPHTDGTLRRPEAQTVEWTSPTADCWVCGQGGYVHRFLPLKE